MISTVLRSLLSAFKTRCALGLEILALRQQVAVLRRSVKRPRLSNVDRGFWVLLFRIWKDWRRALVIVKPETVTRGHPSGFKRYWTWKSRKRGPLSLEKDAPDSRPVEPPEVGKVVAIPKVGGLHHHYTRLAA